MGKNTHIAAFSVLPRGQTMTKYATRAMACYRQKTKKKTERNTEMSEHLRADVTKKKNFDFSLVLSVFFFRSMFLKIFVHSAPTLSTRAFFSSSKPRACGRRVSEKQKKARPYCDKTWGIVFRYFFVFKTFRGILSARGWWTQPKYSFLAPLGRNSNPQFSDPQSNALSVGPHDQLMISAGKDCLVVSHCHPTAD